MNKRDFLSEIECFLLETGMSATVFGIKTIKDSRLVFMLREGRECREETQKRVLEFMREYGDNNGRASI
jgi:predicted transcriptional regulator